MIVLAVLYVAALVFMIIGWRRLAHFVPSIREPSTSVSVIIAARNEEEKLEVTIRNILDQDYPRDLFELIIVDDHSTDRTAAIVKGFKAQGVRLIELNESQQLNSYKKKAISEAIKNSASELIVTTDADCRMGPLWLRNIVGLYEEKGYKLISSPVAYFEEKNSFEEMQTLEFLFLIGLGASAIGNKYAATCNGANLAYNRDVFLELRGFEGIDELASGDDELFLHKLAAAYPRGFGFCLSTDAIVFTHAKPDVQSLIQQRRRWASKSTKYKNKALVMLGITVWTFNLAILFSVFAAFWNDDFWIIALAGFIPKVLIELFFLIPVCRFAGRISLLPYQPFLSFVHMFYLVYIGIAGNTGKYEWKGRSVQ